MGTYLFQVHFNDNISRQYIYIYIYIYILRPTSNFLLHLWLQYDIHFKRNVDYVFYDEF